jgi:hypothetical protein
MVYLSSPKKEINFLRLKIYSRLEINSTEFNICHLYIRVTPILGNKLIYSLSRKKCRKQGSVWTDYSHNFGQDNLNTFFVENLL